MARGDHIRVRRSLYFHHGIDCGDGTVIHYTGSPSRIQEAKVERTSLEAFAKGRRVHILEYKHEVSPDEIMARAESRLEEKDYDLIFNNCEHFASWCVTGVAKSRQAQKALVLAGAVVCGAIVVASQVAKKAPKEGEDAHGQEGRARKRSRS